MKKIMMVRTAMIFALMLLSQASLLGQGFNPFRDARESAQLTQSMNNMKQMALAVHISYDEKQHLPMQASLDADGKPLLSWRVHILPYIEQKELYDQFHLDEPWDSEHNKTLISKMPAIYESPFALRAKQLAEKAKQKEAAKEATNEEVTEEPKAEEGDKGAQKKEKVSDGKTVYQTIGHEKGLLGMTKPTRFQDITDGTSNTVMLVETDLEHAVIWTAPEDFKVDEESPSTGLALLRNKGYLLGFGDGTVQHIKKEVDAKNLVRAFFRNDGEIVELPR